MSGRPARHLDKIRGAMSSPLRLLNFSFTFLSSSVLVVILIQEIRRHGRAKVKGCRRTKVAGRVFKVDFIPEAVVTSTNYYLGREEQTY